MEKNTTWVNKVPRSLVVTEYESVTLNGRLEQDYPLYTDALEFVRKAFNGRNHIKQLIVVYEDGFTVCTEAEPRPSSRQRPTEVRTNGQSPE